jgi:hypothetical protein
MYSTKELIELNEKLRNSLNENNKLYYEDILVYIRVGGNIFKDEKQTEEVLMELLNDLIEAQEQGISAQEYLGKSPKVMSDEIIKNISIGSKKEIISLLGYGFFAFIIASFLPDLVKPNDGMDIGKMFILAAFNFTGVILIFKIISQDIFLDRGEKTGIYIFGCTFLYIAISIIIKVSVPDLWIVYLKGWIGISIIIIISIISLIFEFKNKMLISLVPVTLSVTLFSVLTRLDVTSSFFNSKSGDMVIVSGVIISMIAYFIISYLQQKFSDSTN